MALGLAFKAFFQILFRKEVAQAVAEALASAGKPPTPALPDKPLDTPRPAKPSGRSDALTLLATLQREGRFLDLVGESLDGFEDAQVGAAARQVIADVRSSLDRMFSLAPLTTDDEGSRFTIPKPASPLRFHIVGRHAEQATHGSLIHRGWKAGRCELPNWNGVRDDAMVLSPIEIEVDGQ